MMHIQLPRLFITGFTKCATSSLYDWLVQHPDIHGGFQKELEFLYDEDSYFFNAERNVNRQGLDGYAALYDSAVPTTATLIDATPAYAHHETARATLASMDIKPLAVFVTRNPIDQVISTYHYFSNNKLYIDPSITIEDFFEMVIDGRATTEFEQDHLKNALDWACFDYWLALWKRDVGADRVLVLDMSTMITAPQEACNAVFTALGLPNCDTINFVSTNETYFVKNKAIQRINTVVRGFIPKGQLYKTARNVYRKLNTRTQKPQQSRRLQDLKAQLSARIEARQKELLTTIRPSVLSEFAQK